LASIYQAGVDFAAHKPEDLLRIQQSLDQVTAMIYARIGVGLNEAYSATLLIHPEGEEDDGKELPPPEADETSTTAQLTHEETGVVLQPDLSSLNQAPVAPVVHADREASHMPLAEEAKPMPA
jgi:hypothetical protein